MKTNLSRAVIYQLYPRTCTAEGTIAAAEKLIPHIASLGIDILYMSACNVEDTDTAPESLSPRQKASGMNNPKNPYRIADYFDIDEEYGTIDDLKRFVETAHAHGLKVLIDLVYLHCGPNAVFLREHPEFVLRDGSGKIILGSGWPFPRLNFAVPALREYLWDNMVFYISDIGADGFRCDCAEYLPMDFWVEGLRRIKAIDPDVIMLNEGENPASFAVFDINYRWQIIDPLNDLFCNPDNSLKPQHRAVKEPGVTALTLKHCINETYADIPAGKYVLCNSENHDTISDMGAERPEIHLGPDAAEAILALVFTLKGVPMLYNGCEVADTLPKNMFWNRFCPGGMSVQWENALTQAGQARMALLRKLIGIHRLEAVCGGSFSWIDHDCEADVLCYQRTAGDSRVTVMVNATAKEQLVHAVAGKTVLHINNAEIREDAVFLKPYGVLITQD